MPQFPPRGPGSASPDVAGRRAGWPPGGASAGSGAPGATGRKRRGGRRGGAESPGSARPPPPRGGDRGPAGPPVAVRGGNAERREQVGAGPGSGGVAGWWARSPAECAGLTALLWVALRCAPRDARLGREALAVLTHDRGVQGAPRSPRSRPGVRTRGRGAQAGRCHCAALPLALS